MSTGGQLRCSCFGCAPHARPRLRVARGLDAVPRDGCGRRRGATFDADCVTGFSKSNGFDANSPGVSRSSERVVPAPTDCASTAADGTDCPTPRSTSPPATRATKATATQAVTRAPRPAVQRSLCRRNDFETNRRTEPRRSAASPEPNASGPATRNGLMCPALTGSSGPRGLPERLDLGRSSVPAEIEPFSRGAPRSGASISAGTRSDEAMLLGASDLTSAPSTAAGRGRERRHWPARAVPSMSLPD